MENNKKIQNKKKKIILGCLFGVLGAGAVATAIAVPLSCSKKGENHSAWKQFEFASEAEVLSNFPAMQSKDTNKLEPNAEYSVSCVSKYHIEADDDCSIYMCIYDGDAEEKFPTTIVYDQLSDLSMSVAKPDGTINAVARAGDGGIAEFMKNDTDGFLINGDLENNTMTFNFKYIGETAIEHAKIAFLYYGG